MEKYDLIIVGAGITGLASAYHIKRENPDMSICILEKKPTYAQGNTGKSASAFRDLFTSDLSYKLTSSSISFYKHIQENIGFDLGMNFCGYLFLMNKNNLDAESVTKVRKRTDTLILNRDQISDLGINCTPNPEVAEIMGLNNIEGGLLGKNCGIIEPDLIASFYNQELEKMSVDMKYNTKVEKLNLEPAKKLVYPGEPFVWQDKTIESVNTNKGIIKATHYLLATDVWATELLDPIGIDSHIRPKKRQIFQVSGEKIKQMVNKNYKNEAGTFPFTIFPKPWIYFRPEPKSQSFWTTVTDDIGRDFYLEEDPQPEISFYNMNVLLVAQEYIPAIKDSKVTSSWAGYYSYNTIDGNYYIFNELNVTVATGSSGSGIMKGDAAGRIISALIAGKEKAILYNGLSVDTSDLGITNRKSPIEELII
jgi:glycine/D-amino acid oxidase-like deaminating enzyme